MRCPIDDTASLDSDVVVPDVADTLFPFDADYNFMDLDAKLPLLPVMDDEGGWAKLSVWEGVPEIDSVVPDVVGVKESRVGSVSQKAVKMKVEPVVVGTGKGDGTCSETTLESMESMESNKGGKKQVVEDSKEDEEAKILARRKKRRMEALARFRSKRANRSFTKKVRYECRKQLADSRPRVKGRFVRKIEMALFRKYGNLYREHLDELKEEQCVPSLS